MAVNCLLVGGTIAGHDGVDEVLVGTDGVLDMRRGIQVHLQDGHDLHMHMPQSLNKVGDHRVVNLGEQSAVEAQIGR